ncbi:methylglyoxal synthase [Candidatus Bathyarchaeota archaeon]|jgi:methylglyoxal synthase|nr:methylglyoxal synthase [Candidatus Bathyarchaeota archaeon]MCX6571266.1 methylglyoxal synthase [Candidatus Aminicenantes bacterium]
MEKTKKIALVAHDNRKRDLKEWVEYNYRTLLRHNLICTGTTGRLVEETIERKFEQDGIAREALKIKNLKSGPLGGDLQLGGMIAEGKIDFVIFFWDPMEPFPHDVDVKALLRMAVLYNIPIACNRSTADFMISSPLMNESYRPVTKDYSDYLNRKLPS